MNDKNPPNDDIRIQVSNWHFGGIDWSGMPFYKN